MTRHFSPPLPTDYHGILSDTMPQAFTFNQTARNAAKKKKKE
jgi:hypothetical protein